MNRKFLEEFCTKTQMFEQFIRDTEESLISTHIFEMESGGTTTVSQTDSPRSLKEKISLYKSIGTTRAQNFSEKAKEKYEEAKEKYEDLIHTKAQILSEKAKDAKGKYENFKNNRLNKQSKSTNDLPNLQSQLKSEDLIFSRNQSFSDQLINVDDNAPCVTSTVPLQSILSTSPQFMDSLLDSLDSPSNRNQQVPDTTIMSSGLSTQMNVLDLLDPTSLDLFWGKDSTNLSN